MFERTFLPWICGALLALGAGALVADDAEAGRERYVEICSKCHGLVTEPVARGPARGRFFAVVALPLGPNLTGIYGRAAGTIEGFRYSKALLEAAPDIVWDAPTLDRWLTDSQAMIRGTYMFVKVEEEARRDVIAYLRRYAASATR